MTGEADPCAIVHDMRDGICAKCGKTVDDLQAEAGKHNAPVAANMITSFDCSCMMDYEHQMVGIAFRANEHSPADVYMLNAEGATSFAMSILAAAKAVRGKVQ